MSNNSNQFSNGDSQFRDTSVGSVDTQVISELNNTLDLTGVGAAEPVTLAEAKNYLRINNTQDDTIIASMITSARRQAEQYLNSDIVAKERVVYYERLTSPVNLYYAPITGVTSITVDGTTLATTGYEVLGLQNPLLRILQGPAEKVRVNYTTVGVNNNEIKIGVLAYIAWLYYNRDAKMNTNWKAWLSPFKTFGYYGVR